jgi:hypothetical protein
VVSGLTVNIRSLIPTKQIVDYESYFAYPNGSLRITTDRRRIVALREYSFKGRVFVYEIQYTPYVGKGLSVAGVIDVLFIDGDGDGQFEERLEASKLSSIPEWIRQL